MKTAAKVFIIIGMVCQFFLIFPIFVGLHALKKLNAATCKADITTGTAVVTLLFCNLIGGILMFLLKDEDFQQA